MRRPLGAYPAVWLLCPTAFLFVLSLNRPLLTAPPPVPPPIPFGYSTIPRTPGRTPFIFLFTFLDFSYPRHSSPLCKGGFEHLNLLNLLVSGSFQTP